MRSSTVPSNGGLRRQQSGAALMIFLAVLLIGVASFALHAATDERGSQKAEVKTMRALAEAKKALIGYAVLRNTRPGSLPCPSPDTDGVAATTCPNMLTGFLPWRTLGLAESRDGYGGPLWYTLSSDFRSHLTSPLNSSNQGQVSMIGNPALTSVIAVVIAPGAALGNQSRPASPRTTDIANYLEGANATGVANQTLEMRIGSLTNNDRLLALRHDELFSAINKRIAAEIRGDGSTGLFEAYAKSANLEKDRLFPLAVLADKSRGASGAVPYDDMSFNLKTMLSEKGWFEVVTYTVANDQKTATITVPSPSVSLCLTPTSATPCAPPL